MRRKPSRAGTRRGGRSKVRRPGNLVAEIVDQITEKQDRVARGPGPAAPAGATETGPAGEPASPYRFVLKCGG